MEKEIISLEEFIKEEPTGNQYNSYKIAYAEHLFSASVSSVYGLEHNIWNELGVKSIYNWKGKLDISVEELKKLLDDNINGIRHCSCCGRIINKGEKCEGYFASTFCMRCWTPKLEKEREWDYSHLD